MIKTKQNPNITVKTIRMQIPIILNGNNTERKPAVGEEVYEEIVSLEAFLRKKAYKNTIIKTSNSFFDDSDMKSEYYLIVVYDELTKTPLLSSRYYFNKSIIANYLKGDSHSVVESNDFVEILDLNNYKDGEIFLADRLSGNISSDVYRKNRNQIFTLFYSEITAYNKNGKLILMVRKEKKDKLLSKYVCLGFNVIGSVMHNGREHWVIIGDLKRYKNDTK
jgi:hypothetical protein